ncbi:MAG: hypothetical protein HDR06_15850 [Lachnospiraceae bacterium]|nr:hypothetical protein [Lachnospiraceae bacterium]
MDYDTFKLIHSELIMSVQYIEQDLKLIYSILKGGDFYDNYSYVENSPLGKLLKSLHEMDQELGYSKIKEEDYDLLNQIREIRNYWCHQCYIDFHYIEDPQEHDKAFQKVAIRLHEDELRVYELQQKIEKLRKSVEKKHRHKKRIQ